MRPLPRPTDDLAGFEPGTSVTGIRAEAIRKTAMLLGYARLVCLIHQLHALSTCTESVSTETAIYFDTATLLQSIYAERQLLQLDVEAVATRDACFASLLLLMEPNLTLIGIFRARQNGNIARKLLQIHPSGIHGCVPEKVGWTTAL